MLSLTLILPGCPLSFNSIYMQKLKYLLWVGMKSTHREHGVWKLDEKQGIGTVLNFHATSQFPLLSIGCRRSQELGYCSLVL